MVMTAVMMYVMWSAPKVSGKDLHRTNFGVVHNDIGNLKSSTTFWYHHFVVQLPDMSDVLQAKCLKRLKRGKGFALSSVCRTYSKANHLTDILLDMNAQVLDEFKELSDAAARNLPELRPEGTKAGRVKRSGGLLPFIGDLLFVAVVGVITFLRKFKKSGTKQNEIAMENGDLRTDAFDIKQENKRLRSDLANLKRRVIQLVTTVEALKGGADASPFGDRMRTLPKIQRPTDAATTPLTTKALVDTVVEVHNQYVDPIISGLMCLIVICVALYLLYRLCNYIRNSTDVYLHFYGHNGSILVKVDSVSRSRYDLDVSGVDGGINATVSCCIFPSLEITWNEVHLIDQVLIPTKLFLQRQVWIFNPLKVFRLYRLLKNHRSEMIKFAILFKDETGFHLISQYPGQGSQLDEQSLEELKLETTELDTTRYTDGDSSGHQSFIPSYIDDDY